MRRRALIAALGATALASPLKLLAQTSGKRPLVAYLNPGREEFVAYTAAAFLDGMRERGYAEGQSFDFAARFADEDGQKLAVLAEELVRARPDVIVAAEPQSALAIRKATQAIPIVAALLVDPVRMGLVASDAHPGGNLTGILLLVEGLSSKQIEIAAELLPGVNKIGLIVNPAAEASLLQQQEIEAAGAAKGIRIIAAAARAKTDLDPAFAALAGAGVGAVIVTRDPLLGTEFGRIAALAAAARLLVIVGEREQAEAGALISYGVNISANFRRAAYFVDKILKGAKPSDLPVEFPTKLEMVVNMKTAKALGLTMPQSILIRADEVIE